MNIADLRRSYSLETLSEHNVPDNPFQQFTHWFEEALRAHLYEPNAMALATANAQGAPSVRMVLLKGFDESGMVFYTNYESRKGGELDENPQAALLFWWAELERQVRIEGRISRVDPEESLAYFQSRPRESQLGAWASPQSRPIAAREVIEQNMAELESRFADQEALPLPPNWGGFRLVPAVFEFWQGRENRLHDRIVYTRTDAGWHTGRIAP
ncbi:MAG: pyridoxamine 5'-phosphate oxidase [Saprospiraceae bacterium]|nr:pyridoxamine 5'-phosphate oxidase [Saprospiraceae bacterium]